MTTSRAAIGLLVLLLGGALRGEPVNVVSTTDGLALHFSGGGLSEIRADGKPVPLSGRAPLFGVRNAGVATFTRVETEDGGTHEGGLVIQDLHRPLGLRLRAGLTGGGKYLALDGTLASPDDPADRCVDLRVALPLDARSFSASPGLSDQAEKKRRTRPERDNTDPAGDTGGDALYPISAACSSDAPASVAMALAPSSPTRLLTSFDPEAGLCLTLRIGLSKSSATPSTTPFHLLIYRTDARWGFRSALERYYSFFPDLFAPRVKKVGLWTSQNVSQLRLPDLYAYHEAGFPTWRTSAGNVKTGVNVPLSLDNPAGEGPACKSVAEYERLCELAADHDHGIASLPYTIVGQRQILHLPALPKSYDEAMHVLDTWTTDEPILFDGPPQAVSFTSADQLRAIIKGSTIRDAAGRLTYVARPYRGPTLTFVQNPNPRLYRDTQTATVAKYTLDEYVPKLLQSTYVDGFYVDSMGRWCGYYNYATEHFRYTDLPLTYAGSPVKPCIWNLQSHFEYLAELSRRMHAEGKMVLANGVHYSRVLLGAACDVMGGEGTPTYDAGENFYALRVAAGRKPYCYLNAPGKSSPKIWNSCLAMGYLLNCNTEEGAKLMARYVPVMVRLNQAGWHPLTLAGASPAAVHVERWGGESPDAPLLFTLLNPTGDAITATLTPDAALRLPEGVRFVDALTGEAVSVGGIALRPGEARAIELRR